MKLINLVMGQLVNKGKTNEVQFAEVTIITKSWWRKKYEVKTICKYRCGSWFFLSSGEFCPGGQMDEVLRSFEAKQVLRELT